jgi:hypothetical protein
MAEESLKIVLTADNKQAIAAMKQTVTSLNEVDSAANKTGGKVVAMGKDFTGLSRVIQDLPYGFNAIANNLTNILPAAGAAGLAISALVAGLQFASLGFGNWTRGLIDAKKANEDFAQSLAKEKVELNSLFASATNANLSLSQRLNAVKELRSNYGAYLKNYTDEDILVGKAADAHMKLTEALRMEAKAASIRTMAMPLEQKLIENELKQTELLTKLKEDYRKAGQGGVETISGGPGMPSVRITPQQRQKGVTAQATRELTALVNESKAAKAELDKLYGLIQAPAPMRKTADGKTVVQGTKEENAELERQIQAYKNLKFAMMGQGTIMPEREKGKDLTNLKLTLQGNTAYNDILQRNNDLEKQKLANMELANNLTNTAMNSLNGLTNAMMNGQNIGQALGDMFKRLALDIALAAAKAAIFQAILSAVSGGTSKGAGGGGFFKMFGKMLGFSEGGTVSGPRSGYPVMLHGTEHIVRPDQMRSIIASASQMGGGSNRVVVEGVVRGNDIWLSQSRTNTFRALTT